MIESATWNETGSAIKVVMDDGTEVWVPDDMANRHRVELDEWEKEGNVIGEYVSPAEVK